MTYQELIKEIKSLGLPCAFDSFDEPPKIPYTVLAYGFDSGFTADNQTYRNAEHWQLEYYNDIKHPPTEKLIEQKLRELRLPFEKSGTKIPDQNLYQIVYDIKLIGE